MPMVVLNKGRIYHHISYTKQTHKAILITFCLGKSEISCVHRYFHFKKKQCKGNQGREPSPQCSALISALLETCFPSSIKQPDLAQVLNQNSPRHFSFVHTESQNSSNMKPNIIIEGFIFISLSLDENMLKPCWQEAHACYYNMDFNTFS